VVTHFRKSVAALRWVECWDTSQVPPPTLPVDGEVSPCHCGMGATAICLAGVLSPLWKTAPPYQAGPGMSRTFLASFLVKSVLKTPLMDIDLFLISTSSSLAILVQASLVVLTETALGPVMWLAPHLLAHR